MKFPINSWVSTSVGMGFVTDYRTMHQYHWYLVQFDNESVWMLEKNLY